MATSGDWIESVLTLVRAHFEHPVLFGRQVSGPDLKPPFVVVSPPDDQFDANGQAFTRTWSLDVWVRRGVDGDMQSIVKAYNDTDAFARHLLASPQPSDSWVLDAPVFVDSVGASDIEVESDDLFVIEMTLYQTLEI